MVKTTKAFLKRIEKALAPAGTVRTRSMMGGYLIYLDETLIGQANEN